GPPPPPPAIVTSLSTRLERDELPRSSPLQNPEAAPPAASPNEMSPDRPSLFLPHEFDAAVKGLAFIGIVRRDRLRAAIADRREPARWQSGLDEIIRHHLRPFFGERLVEAFRAVGVGVSCHLDIDGRAAQRNFDQMIEQPCGIRIEGGKRGYEEACSLG